MDSRKLTSHQIKEINKLIERKESLESELQKIDQQLDVVLSSEGITG